MELFEGQVGSETGLARVYVELQYAVDLNRSQDLR